jgi:hypothetical protein
MPVQAGKEESKMLDHFRGYAKKASLAAATALLVAAPALLAQSSSGDRWLHVRVVSTDAKGETVRVNIPLDLAEKVLPTINKDRLHNGKVKIDDTRIDGGDVDLHALLDAIRTSKDGEFVTVQSTENDVRVAKQGGQLIVHVTDRSGHGIHHHHMKHNDADKAEDQKDDKDSAKTNKEQQVEVKIPMKVIDALFSAGKDELDLVAALRALSTQGDTELVSVKDEENTVRVWLDSKNVAN